MVNLFKLTRITRNEFHANNMQLATGYRAEVSLLEAAIPIVDASGTGSD